MRLAAAAARGTAHRSARLPAVPLPPPPRRAASAPAAASQQHPPAPRARLQELDAPAQSVGLEQLPLAQLLALGARQRARHVGHRHAAVELAQGHVVVHHLCSSWVGGGWVGKPAVRLQPAQGAPAAAPRAAAAAGPPGPGRRRPRPRTSLTQALDDSGWPASISSFTISSRSVSNTLRNSCAVRGAAGCEQRRAPLLRGRRAGEGSRRRHPFNRPSGGSGGGGRRSSAGDPGHWASGSLIAIASNTARARIARAAQRRPRHKSSAACLLRLVLVQLGLLSLGDRHVWVRACVQGGWTRRGSSAADTVRNLRGDGALIRYIEGRPLAADARQGLQAPPASATRHGDQFAHCLHSLDHQSGARSLLGQCSLLPTQRQPVQPLLAWLLAKNGGQAGHSAPSRRAASLTSSLEAPRRRDARR